MSGSFCFTDAVVYTTDCSRNLTSVSSAEDVKVPDDVCWPLLEQCISRLPLRKTYELLDQLYGNQELQFPEGKDFVVESIRARSVNKDTVYYFVKWDGWPPVFNTWEPETNLVGCEVAIREFMEKCGSSVGILPPEANVPKIAQVYEVMERLKEATSYSCLTAQDLLTRFTELLPPPSATPRPYKQPCLKTGMKPASAKSAIESFRAPMKRSTNVNFFPVASKRVRLTKKDKQTLVQCLDVFRQRLNAVYPSEAPITVENTVDSESPPVEFQPIPDYLAGKDVYLPSKAPVGCECATQETDNSDVSSAANTEPINFEPCWENRRRGCCAARAGFGAPYNKQKRLIAPIGHPVYECNSRCPCGPSCPFRVVQLGRKVPLCVFRTRDRGWGVKANSPIAKGTFVAEYLGEILTFEEAEKRGVIYDKQTMTYLFDLDFDGDAHFTVDASQMGNISHFFNHSCDPNLTVRCVFVECLDTKLPRIALFASRFIRKGEELTFDYNMTGAIHEVDVARVTQDHQSLAEFDPSDSIGNTGRKSPSLSHSSTEPPADTGSEISYDSKSVTSKGPRMKCLCRSKNCRGFLVA